jgi:hypothetical protein
MSEPEPSLGADGSARAATRWRRREVKRRRLSDRSPSIDLPSLALLLRASVAEVGGVRPLGLAGVGGDSRGVSTMYELYRRATCSTWT